MSTSDEKTSVEAICDQIGRKVIRDRLGVGKQSISNAVISGEFPARWFPVIRDLCLENDLPPPEDHLFNFAKAEIAAQ